MRDKVKVVAVAVTVAALAAVAGHYDTTPRRDPVWIIQRDTRIRVPAHWTRAWITCLPDGKARIHAREHAARAVYIIPGAWLHGQCGDGSN